MGYTESIFRGAIPTHYMCTLCMTCSLFSLAAVQHLFVYRHLTILGRRRFPLHYKFRMFFIYSFALFCGYLYSLCFEDMATIIENDAKVITSWERVLALKAKDNGHAQKGSRSVGALCSNVEHAPEHLPHFLIIFGIFWIEHSEKKSSALTAKTLTGTGSPSTKWEKPNAPFVRNILCHILIKLHKNNELS